MLGGWLDAVITTLTLVTIAVGVTYFVVVAAAGLLELRAHRRCPVPVPRPSGDAHLYFLVPCLNESLVIGQTVAELRRTPGCTIVVIDDGSDDDTAAIAARFGGDQTKVVRRELPRARQGKGQALNRGFAVVLEDVRRTGRKPEDVFVCVMDADGRLSEHAWAHVLPLFADPAVGAVQLAVKIRNTDRLITRLQDFEFWGLSAISQYGRRRTRTVSLGGNGQFARLTALPDRPWSDSLTEDLDLAITLAVAGWALESTPSAWVDQQGVTEYPRLLRQRTRWFQGHMCSGKRLLELWRSPRLARLAKAELTAYLLVPWVLSLPWSVLIHIGLIRWGVAFASDGPMLTGSAATQVVTVVLWYLVSCLPLLFAGSLYYVRQRGYGLLRSLALGHLLLLWNYVAFIACWRAVGRMLRGRTQWDKTARSAEAVTVGVAMRG